MKKRTTKENIETIGNLHKDTDGTTYNYKMIRMDPFHITNIPTK